MLRLPRTGLKDPTPRHTGYAACTNIGTQDFGHTCSIGMIGTEARPHWRACAGQACSTSRCVQTRNMLKAVVLTRRTGTSHAAG